jgi:PAS domain S-box-containing protein
MSEMIVMTKEEIVNLENRLNDLAREKADLQLLMNMMTSLSLAHGFDDVIETLLRIVFEHLHGNNVAVFYKIDDAVLYSDVLGEKRRLDVIEDPLVREVFETHQHLESEDDFDNPEPTAINPVRSKTLVYPLLTGPELFGVIKIENAHLPAGELRTYLSTVFNHAALILKNGIDDCARLRKTNSGIDQKNAFHRAVERELHEAKECLEEKVNVRTSELARTNRLYSVLSHVNQATVRADSRERFLSEVCRVAVEYGEFHLAWIGMVDWETLEVRPIAHNGSDEDYLAGLKITVEDRAEGWGTAGTAIREARSAVINCLLGDPKVEPWREAILKTGFRAVAASPIFRAGKADGVLVVYSRERDFFHEREVSLLEEIAADISLGLDLVRAESERKRKDEALRESEARFRDLYENAPNAYFSIGLDGLIIRCNRQAGKLLDCLSEELIGRPFMGLYADTKVGKEKAARVMKMFLAGGAARDEELEMRRFDDVFIWINLTLEEARDATEKVVEIRAMVVDITDRKKAGAILRRLNRELRAVTECNQILLRANDEFTLLKEICRVICDEAGYRLAWVGYTDNAPSKNVRPVACSGFGSEYVKNLQITWSDEDEQGSGPIGHTIRTGEVVFVQDFESDPRVTKWRESALKYGYRSGIALPLKDEKNKVFGALLLYSSEAHSITLDEMRLMMGLADDLAFGINSIRARAARNIAEEKAARLAAIVESSEDAIIGKNLEGVIVSWNRGAEKIYGYSEQEIIGKPVTLLAIPEEVNEIQRIMEKIRSGQHIDHYETARRRKDGATIYISLTVSPVFGADGKISGASAIARDITESKRLERALRESERLYRLLAENAKDMIVDCLPNGVIAYVSPACRTLLGYEQEDLLVTDGAVFVHPDYVDMVRETFSSAKPLGVDFSVEYPSRIKNGEYIWVETSGRFRCNLDNGKVENIVCVVRDISERKRAEEEIRRLNIDLEQRVRERTEELEEANKELEAFTYSVSHDLRAPLRHLTGFSDLLMKRASADLDEKCKHYLSVISQSAVELSRLIDDILSFSRLGRAEITKTCVNMQELVKEVLRMAQPDTEGRDVLWSIEDLPDAYGSREMLRMVLGNLISNAVKFTGRKQQALIEIGHKSDNPDEDVFFVRDNGAGFDMKYSNKLFGLFQRLHRAEEFEGTGLGLANVRRIIHRHGGRTWAEGAIGEGAVFYFSLPKK